MNETDIKKLIDQAIAVRKNGYSPYFKIFVGAALLDSKGKIHVGCNMENASGSAMVCAESNALGALLAAGEKSIKALAVVGLEDRLLYPCGVCRQKLAEFNPNLDIYVANTKGKYEHHNLSVLLPHIVKI